MPEVREVPEFQQLLIALAKEYPNRSAFAAAIGVDPSRLSKALSGKGDVFDVVGCLRIARATGKSPSAILRAAGRGSVADLIERLYGPPRRVSAEDETILNAVQRLPSAMRRAIVTLIENGPASVDDVSTSRPERKRRVG
jgi:hypothetical protein